MVNRVPRVILFEDDIDFRSLLEQFLTSKGYEVISYEDPTLCKLQHSHDCQCTDLEVCSDIMITDIDMPNISGLEFVVNQLNKGCKIQNVGVMSGSWTKEKLEHALSIGCTVFQKPFTLSSLGSWLDRCVERMDSKKLYNWFFKEEGGQIRTPTEPTVAYGNKAEQDEKC